MPGTRKKSRGPDPRDFLVPTCCFHGLYRTARAALCQSVLVSARQLSCSAAVLRDGLSWDDVPLSAAGMLRRNNVCTGLSAAPEAQLAPAVFCSLERMPDHRITADGISRPHGPPGPVVPWLAVFPGLHKPGP